VVRNAQNQPYQQRSIVLVVDDNVSIRDMVSWALELDGFEAAEVADGQEALDWMDNAAREGRYPAVILLDLSMPHMDGDTFLRRLQAQWEKARPIPPIVIITASQNASALPRMFVHQVIVKPFNVRDLLDAVSNVIQ
jgi:CheY-like chemotaxis protein